MDVDQIFQGHGYKVCSVDPFTERHRLIHNGGFPKFGVLYCSKNTVKLINIQ